MRIWRYLDEVARCGSVRQAAEHLNITPSAVLRRIQDVEEDLGEALFELTGTGMLLTTAGEIFINWIRRQNSDLSLVQSQIEEISGIRRGRISIASSPAAAAQFLPRQIVVFQKQHPGVTFAISVASHEQAIKMLIDYDVDLALIFAPPLRAEVQSIVSIGQRLSAVMREGHPLAARPVLRLRNCLEYPLALLDRSFAGRRMIDNYISGSPVNPKIVAEANTFEFLAEYVANSDAITFQVAIGTEGLSADRGLVARPVSDADKAYAPLVLMQLKGRAQPIAASRFAQHVSKALQDKRMKPLEGEHAAIESHITSG